MLPVVALSPLGLHGDPGNHLRSEIVAACNARWPEFPKEIHITPDMERLLYDHFVIVGCLPKDPPDAIRRWKDVLGMLPVWDAIEFKLC